MTIKKLSFAASIRSREMPIRVLSRQVTAERLPPCVLSARLACITLNVKPNRKFPKVPREGNRERSREWWLLR